MRFVYHFPRFLLLTELIQGVLLVHGGQNSKNKWANAKWKERHLQKRQFRSDQQHKEKQDIKEMEDVKEKDMFHKLS